YRVEIEGRRAQARKALNHVLRKGEETPVRARLQAAVKEFLERLERFVPEVSAAMAERILDLAEILAVGRPYVCGGKNDDNPRLPQAELASRVAKQRLRLGMGVAIVRGRRQVTDAELAVMKRVALDSLPTNRRLLLAALWEGRRDEKLQLVGRDLDYFTARVPA